MAECLGGFWRRVRARRTALLAASLLGLILALSGLGDIEVQAARSVLQRHAIATPHLVLVEIDDASLDALGVWPISRRYYAQAIDRLFAAGARRVVLNLSFSLRQNPGSDAALAAAIGAHPGRVVLFVQHLDHPGPGVAAVVPPVALLAERAVLGSADIPYARGDGTILRVPYGARWDGVTYRSFTAAIADIRAAPVGFFPIDTAIARDAIPRLRFADLVSRPLPAGLVAGRTVIIGLASDRVPDFVRLAGYGRIAATEMLALGAETLLEGPIVEISRYAVLALAILLAVVAFGWGGRRGMVLLAVAACAGIAVQFALPPTVFVTVVPALAVWFASLIALAIGRRRSSPYSPAVQM